MSRQCMGAYLILGKNINPQVPRYPLPEIVACRECKELLSFRSILKEITMHDKCFVNNKKRQAKLRALLEVGAVI